MKRVVVALLCLGLLCSSTLAMAEGPVPFRALMQTEGAQPSVAPLADAKAKSAAASTQPPHTRHMTTGGKVMTRVGIGMLVIGGIVLIGTAAVGENSWASSSDKAKLYGAGAGIFAGGTILIVVGNHRRAAQ